MTAPTDGGELWREAFRALAPEALDRNYALVARYCGLTQKALNEKAGLGLQPVLPKHDRDRAEGITKHVSSAKDPQQAAARLATDVESYDRHIVDESVRENADFHFRSGLRATVTRIAAPGCCKWCTELAGEYLYAEVKRTGDDVWRRHANCGCRIEYDPGNGSGRVEVNNYVSGRRERLHPDAEAERRDERKAIPSGHEDAAPEKIKERMAIPGGHPDVRSGGEPQFSGTKKNTPTDVTAEYFRNARPGEGNILFDNGYDYAKHPHEIAGAKWVHATFGEDILLQREKNAQNIKTADYFWRGRLWDWKEISSEKAANSAVRHGVQQISTNAGGLFINCADRCTDHSALIDIVNRRMLWYQTIQMDIVLLQNGNVLRILRYNAE